MNLKIYWEEKENWYQVVEGTCQIWVRAEKILVMRRRKEKILVVERRKMFAQKEIEENLLQRRKEKKIACKFRKKERKAFEEF